MDKIRVMVTANTMLTMIIVLSLFPGHALATENATQSQFHEIINQCRL